MSNALCAMAAATAPTAPAGTQPSQADCAGMHPLLLGLVAVGLCVLLVWIIRRAAHPGKVSLRQGPGRRNRVHPLHVLGILAAMFLSAAAAQGALLAAFGPDPSDPAAEAVKVRLAIAAGAVSATVWLVAGLIVAAVTFRHGLARGLGLSCRRWLYDTARGTLAYLAILPVCVGLNLAMVSLFDAVGIKVKVHVVLEHIQAFPVEWKALSVLSTVVLAPLSEEVFFRGIFQSMLRRWTRGPWPAVLGASALFAAFHIGQPQAIPSLFALAVAMGYNYERTGRLFAPILIHAVFNAVNLYVWTTS